MQRPHIYFGGRAMRRYCRSRLRRRLAVLVLCACLGTLLAVSWHRSMPTPTVWTNRTLASPMPAYSNPYAAVPLVALGVERGETVGGDPTVKGPPSAAVVLDVACPNRQRPGRHFECLEVAAQIRLLDAAARRPTALYIGTRKILLMAKASIAIRQ
eukprot:SAG31_NODE_10534_length_1127_cov_1.384241_1_plen_156_part_00